MKLPIKLNEAGWPPSFSRLTFAFHDPRPLAKSGVNGLSPMEFSRAISTLQFGVTFKSTRPGRQAHSNQFISQLYRGYEPVILDVGASDGSTSLDLIKSFDGNFGHYYVTDLNLSTRCGNDNRGVVYFLDRNGDCSLRASKRFLVYCDVNGALFPLRFIAGALLRGSRKVDEWFEVLLIQPELVRLAARDARISIMPYDLFAPWRGEPPDVIKVANLLNGKYFTGTEMKQALKVQCSNLVLGGRLLLVSEDDDIEKFSVFRKTPAGMVLERTHEGGAKAACHVPSVIDMRAAVNGRLSGRRRSEAPRPGAE